jgi:hypothetical protein
MARGKRSPHFCGRSVTRRRNPLATASVCEAVLFRPAAELAPQVIVAICEQVRARVPDCRTRATAPRTPPSLSRRACTQLAVARPSHGPRPIDYRGDAEHNRGRQDRWPRCAVTFPGTLPVGHAHRPAVRAVSDDLPLLYIDPSQRSASPPFFRRSPTTPDTPASGRLPTDAILRPPAAARHVAAGQTKSEMRSRMTAYG